MLTFFYTLIIFPIETVISIFYWIFIKMFEIHGIAIICLSITVNLISLPLYNVAEKWQQRERNIQARLKRKLEDIKAVFKGAERHMIIRTYYRQNNYHPFYSLRNILGLAIQVPFFIAAYHMLSHLPMTLKTSSYYFITDLRIEDQLFTIWGISINLLPIIMTAINLLSVFVYSEKLQKKEKNQLLLMALLFLVLLYKSPSGLVLYWTMNNVISLIKNIINSSKNPKKYFFITFTCLLSFLFFFSIMLRFPIFMKIADLGGFIFKGKKIMLINLMIGSLLTFVLLFPFIYGIINKFIKNIFSGLNEKSKDGTAVFILSCFIVFLLTGLLAPSLLISGSTLEYVEIISGDYYNPAWAIVKSALQGFSLFVFIPTVIYFLFSGIVRKYLIFFSFLFMLISLLNIFIFPGSYGIISREFVFDNPNLLKTAPLLISMNFIGLIIVSLIGIVLIKKSYYRIINNILIILLISLTSISFFNIIKINSEFKNMLTYKSSLQNHGENINEKFQKIFNFSKNGKNVFVVMLDRGLGSLMGEVLLHNPELSQQMQGFVWYNNIVSFNGHTVLGAPPLFGGYEYTPIEINKRDQVTLTDKHSEALLVMPCLFLENGYHVVVTDPCNSNIHIYDKYPGIYADELIGKYSIEWINENIKNEDNRITVNIASTLENYLFNFSLFRIMPSFFRSRIYDGGNWLKPYQDSLPLIFINSFSVLDYLPKITAFDSDGDTFSMTTNNTVHSSKILQIYLPEEFKSELTESGNYLPPFNDRITLKHFYSQIAALQRFCNWFNYLKENGVYDNTKIIIVSDHGRNVVSPCFNNFSEVEEERKEYSFYHPLLLVKDFNASGELSVSNDFMTNADVPAIATSHLANAVNPFTGNELKGNYKNNGVDIVVTHSWKQEGFNKYKHGFKDKDIIHIKENIFIKDNWKRKVE